MTYDAEPAVGAGTTTDAAGTRGRRRGFALPAALLAIVVIGAALVAGHATASSETMTSESEQQAALAVYAAERGMALALATVNRSILDTIPIDASTTVLTGQSNGLAYQVTARRLATQLYLFVASGEIPRGNRVGASRTIAALVRVRDMAGDFNQAMMVMSGAKLKGSVTVSGTDLLPAKWNLGIDNCASEGVLPGIVAKEDTTVKISGGANVTGNPAVAEDTTLNADDFLVYGSLTFDDLVAVAKTTGKVYEPNTSETGAAASVVNGVCRTNVLTNWGAPTDSTNACHFYFPMIYAKGNFTYGGNSIGQGILLVEGDLHLAGTAIFYGIVIVKGRLTVGNTGGGAGNTQVYGTVLVANDGEMQYPASEISGNPTIQYSSCSITRAKKYNEYTSLAVPVNGRNWLDFTNASGTF